MAEQSAENDAGLDIAHIPAVGGQSCRISVNGQGHLPCSMALVEPCKCPEGPYYGARQVTTASICERCGRLTMEQIEHIVWKFGSVTPPEVDPS